MLQYSSRSFLAILKRYSRARILIVTALRSRSDGAWRVSQERARCRTFYVQIQGGHVREVFRNAPDATTRLRNNGPLEFPTSPVLFRHRLCLAQTDVARRDNFPNSGGEGARRLQ